MPHLTTEVTEERRSGFAQSVRYYLFRSPMMAALIFIVFVWFASSTVLYFVEANAKDHNINTFEDAVWWGIVTLLTVGYGDKFPVTSIGRIFGAFLMCSGVTGIAVVTAKISSYFLERALRERRGFVDSSALKKHFVICGWKGEMPEFLLNILDSNLSIRDEDIVLLNDVQDSLIESIHETPRLKNIKVVKGDFFSEINLKKVAPDRATKILILADATPDAQGKIPTITEADARTIMTAMTLNNIAKGTPVAAEILDPSMDHYLRLAQVNEIIYSRDYSRMLVALASTGTGVTNVFHDLMSSKSPHFICTQEIPDQYMRKTYRELITFYEQQRPGQEIIGLLENSGNSHVAKEKALRRAQQTTNITELVTNLTAVKALRFNQPKFCLSADYVIQEGSMAIVIENRGDAHG